MIYNSEQTLNIYTSVKIKKHKVSGNSTTGQYNVDITMGNCRAMQMFKRTCIQRKLGNNKDRNANKKVSGTMVSDNGILTQFEEYKLEEYTQLCNVSPEENIQCEILL